MTRPSERPAPSAGVTLLEAVVAALVLEIGLLAVVGQLTLAMRVLTRAERIESAVGKLEALADSLVEHPALFVDSIPLEGGGWLSWRPIEAGAVVVGHRWADEADERTTVVVYPR